MNPNERVVPPKLSFSLLIVEDSQDDAFLIAENLGLQGLEVKYDVVDNPVDFRNALMAHPYDAILCDHLMPKFSSFDALSILHELHLDIPFIIVSGVIGEDMAVDAMKLGANDYVMKKTIKRLGVAIQREVREAANRVKIRKSEAELRLSEQAYKELSEKLVEAVKARDSFIAIASHEFKTPISVIMLQMEMNLRNLTQGKISTLNQEALKKVFDLTFRQAKSLARLVDNLLGLTMVNNNSKITITPQRGVDLNVLIQELMEKILSESYPVEHEKNLFCIKLYEDPLIVDVDPQRIEQVMNNLISNAVKYGDQKAVEVELGVRDSNWAEIRVKDQGPGISAEDQSRIFKPFQRGKSTEGIGGLGLGLFITSEILKAHQGSLFVDSFPGKGSMFTARIPLAQR